VKKSSKTSTKKNRRAPGVPGTAGKAKKKETGTRSASVKQPALKKIQKETQKDRLIKELNKLLPGVDEEGLIFLLKQANVLLHNLQVDKINREIVQLDKKKKTGAASAGASAVEEDVAVSIDESSDKKFFHLTLGGTRKTMTLGEIREIVRACYEPKSKSEALNRIFGWLSRERGDILMDAQIGNSRSPLLNKLFYAIRSKYRLRD